MTNENAVSDKVGKRIRDVRERRGLSVKELAARCREQGVPLSEQAIYNIENGRPDKEGRRRRNVTVDELLGLAVVLDVAPVHLLVPPDAPGVYSVTARTSATAPEVRSWVRGVATLTATDPRTFWTEVPRVEFGDADPDEPGRREWIWANVRYLTRSMGRLYRRDDGTAVFELELPKAPAGGQG